MIFRNENDKQKYVDERGNYYSESEMRSLVNGEGVPENILDVEDIDD